MKSNIMLLFCVHRAYPVRESEIGKKSQYALHDNSQLIATRQHHWRAAGGARGVYWMSIK